MQTGPEKPKNSSNSQKKSYLRTIDISGKEVTFLVKDAIYTKILDEEMLIDKVAIDFMIDEIAEAIRSNSSNTSSIPQTVILSQENIASMFSKESGTNFSAAVNNSMIKDNTLTINAPIKNSPPIVSVEPKAINPSPEINSFEETFSGEIEDSIKQATKKDEFLKIYKPKYSFDDVYVEPVFKRRILSALIMAKERKKIYEDWGLLSTLKNARPLVLNFYGPPGTGKSMMAEAIAHYLNRDVFLVSYSELESGTPGETPKNIVRCFKKATESNAVLIFDEADSFLGKRLTNVSSAADYSVNITRSVMLIELEKFDGILIFTTNFISNYDIAFKRRILASMEFKLPDEKGRAHIWQSHIPKQLPLSPGITPMALAYKYGGTTGADIKDIVLFAAVNCLEKGRERLSWEDFDEAYQAVKNRYSVI